MIYGRVITPEGVVRVPIRVSVQRAGLPQFVVQGLPGQSRQFRQIILTAVKSSGWKMPPGRVVVDCQLPVGSVWATQGLGLAVAIALIESPTNNADFDVIGVLELDGSVALPKELAALALPLGKPLLTALPPVGLASILQQSDWRYCRSLREYVERGGVPVPFKELPSHSLPPLPSVSLDPLHLLCLSLVWAGGHSLVLFGAPGEGKTLSRAWLQALAPSLSNDALRDRLSLGEAWQPTRLAPLTLPSPTDSIAKWIHPRFGWLRQGSQGAIWMDEFPSLPTSVRTRLRGWIEDTDLETQALHSRHWQAAFVATMNPCPCGYWGEPQCVCRPAQVAHQLSKVSWPLLDRFALQWRVQGLLGEEQIISPEECDVLRQRIQRARDTQFQRSQRLNAVVDLTELPTRILRTEHVWRMRLSEWSARRQVQFCQVVQTLLDGGWAATANEACETAWLLCRGTEFLRKVPATAR